MHRALEIVTPMRFRRSIIRMLASLALVLLCAPAFALMQWDFNSGCNTSGQTYGNSCSWTAGTGANAVTVTATAWSNTSGSANTIDSAYLGAYPGLGVINKDSDTAAAATGTDKGDTAEGTPSNSVSPEHATDNNQRYDFILFTFSKSLNLQDVSISYPTSNTCNGVSPCDSDISVLAYTGGSSPTFSGVSYSSALTNTANGWTLVGSYSNVKDSIVTVNIDGQGNTSKSMTALINQPTSGTPASSPYWIVAAYSSILQGSSNSYACNSSTTGKPASGVTCDGGNDYVKVISLFGSKTTNKVPEPSSLLLLGMVATIGVWGSRRRGAAPAS